MSVETNISSSFFQVFLGCCVFFLLIVFYCCVFRDRVFSLQFHNVLWFRGICVVTLKTTEISNIQSEDVYFESGYFILSFLYFYLNITTGFIFHNFNLGFDLFVYFGFT